ncbi:divalent-cation tolerance protein CutA [uncultured Pseudacidovorax sp.]|uniref:divalent-cation tolerance protein CutA n=1 Tax=uncultured Pseudacidovorax sp. TaxID=679313 RepID=UPI0025F93BEA|nr:divalent-cation tolerance protein CutA [uncultured Pseudacidovorax sp.]
MTDTACVVMTTAGTEEEAEDLAGAMVEAGLAACVQIQRVRSVYRWEGETRREPEWLLICKTRAGRFEALQALIDEKHSYAVPEVVQLPITAGSPAYLRWLAEATAEPSAAT